MADRILIPFTPSRKVRRRCPTCRHLLPPRSARTICSTCEQQQTLLAVDAPISSIERAFAEGPRRPLPAAATDALTEGE